MGQKNLKTSGLTKIKRNNMKLISMTKYVLEEHKNYDGIETTQNNFDNIRILALNRIINYANFLKQPLKLGMFVPCDENDVHLDEPKQVSPDGVKWDDYIKQYQQAKERVLFDGFKAEKYGESDEIINAELIKNNSLVFRFPNSFVSKIEDLVKYNITLSDSAIKQHNL